jgi:carbohydrate kinase (thermoresistant glucokinase family)
MTADEVTTAERDDPARVVVMGVTGAGKTTVGRALADRIGVRFLDADDLHPAGNVAKMRAGVPLTDKDRRPWLQAVGGWIAAHADDGCVVACSALKRTYRDVLRSYDPAIEFLHLTVSPELAAQRVDHRADHYMPAALVESQVAMLEPPQAPERFVESDASRPVDEIVGTFLACREARPPDG